MQKDTNFENTIILHYPGPENCQNLTQKDTNFGNTIILHYPGPENCQNLTQKDTNFENTIILHYPGPENCQNPTQKDTNFGNAKILHYLGPENRQNPTQKDTNFEKLHSLTPAKMPTNKESVRFSRNLHHNSDALINPIHTNQPITLETPSNTFSSICRPTVIYSDSSTLAQDAILNCYKRPAHYHYRFSYFFRRPISSCVVF